MSEMENNLLREFIQRQEDFNKTHSENTKKILRGLYGEEENGTIGLVDRVINAENDIKNHKEETGKKFKKQDDFRNKLGWGTAGFILAIEVAWKGVKTWIENK